MSPLYIGGRVIYGKQSSNPSNPVEGSEYFNDSEKVLKYYD